MRYPLQFIAIATQKGNTIYHEGKCLDFLWSSAHNGPNAEVYSIGDGVVTFAGVENKSGNVVYIKHTNGMVSNYAHLSKITVKKGDNVVMGQQVGNMGNTGESYGNHLHLSIWSSMSVYQKSPTKTDVDPLQVLEVYPDQEIGEGTKKYNLKIHQEDTTIKGVVNVMGGVLNVRYDASTNNPRVGALANGFEIEILGEENDFYKITAKGTGITLEGYVSKDYVKKS